MPLPATASLSVNAPRLNLSVSFKPPIKSTRKKRFNFSFQLSAGTVTTGILAPSVFLLALLDLAANSLSRTLPKPRKHTKQHEKELTFLRVVSCAFVVSKIEAPLSTDADQTNSF